MLFSEIRQLVWEKPGRPGGLGWQDPDDSAGPDPVGNCPVVENRFWARPKAKRFAHPGAAAAYR